LPELRRHRLQRFLGPGNGAGVDAAEAAPDLEPKGVGRTSDLGRVAHGALPNTKRRKLSRFALRTRARSQAANCSASTRSSNERSASKSMVRAMSRRSLTSTRATRRTSKLSAVALTGRL